MIVRYELLQKPEPLLREGKRQVTVAGCANDFRKRNGSAVRQQSLHRNRQFREGRVLEQGADRQLHADFAAYAGHYPRGQQRMATESEEVVVNADAVQTQAGAPNAAQSHFQRSARAVLTGIQRRERGRRGELSPIDFSAGGKREFVDETEGIRNHVARQQRLQPAAKLSRI